MAEDNRMHGDQGLSPQVEPYEPPRIESLGTVSELTRGPDPGAGDVPTGVISF